MEQVEPCVDGDLGVDVLLDFFDGGKLCGVGVQLALTYGVVTVDDDGVEAGEGFAVVLLGSLVKVSCRKSARSLWVQGSSGRLTRRLGPRVLSVAVRMMSEWSGQ